MKKLFLLLAFIAVSSFGLKAQVRSENVLPPAARNEALYQAQYVNLLDTQNTLLKSRRSALIVTLAGGCVYGVGESLYQVALASGTDPTAPIVFGVIGAVTTAVGGVWSFVNELKLIDNQKKINDHIKLRYAPGRVALEF